jgi:hypothetical protein
MLFRCGSVSTVYSAPQGVTLVVTTAAKRPFTLRLPLTRGHSSIPDVSTKGELTIAVNFRLQEARVRARTECGVDRRRVESATHCGHQRAVKRTRCSYMEESIAYSS